MKKLIRLFSKKQKPNNLHYSIVEFTNSSWLTDLFRTDRIHFYYANLTNEYNEDV
jgi:hypothetical protein